MSRNTVERNWKAHDLDCAVIRLDMGHRCGYVRVPEDHPWHGVSYHEPAPTVPPSQEVLNEHRVDDDLGVIAAFCYAASSDEKRDEYARTPEFQIGVHGGLTFSGDIGGEDGIPSGHWFGFDCAHAGDTPGVWTEEAVAAETERLAEQLARVKEAHSVAS